MRVLMSTHRTTGAVPVTLPLDPPVRPNSHTGRRGHREAGRVTRGSGAETCLADNTAERCAWQISELISQLQTVSGSKIIALRAIIEIKAQNLPCSGAGTEACDGP